MAQPSCQINKTISARFRPIYKIINLHTLYLKILTYSSIPMNSLLMYCRCSLHAEGVCCINFVCSARLVIWKHQRLQKKKCWSSTKMQLSYVRELRAKRARWTTPDDEKGGRWPDDKVKISRGYPLSFLSRSTTRRASFWVIAEAIAYRPPKARQMFNLHNPQNIRLCSMIHHDV